MPSADTVAGAPFENPRSYRRSHVVAQRAIGDRRRVDDSPAAKVAVDWAARDAERRNVSLTLVYAVSPNLTTWWNTPLSPGLAQWQKEHGRRLLDDAVKVAENACDRPDPTQIHTEVLSSAAIPTLVDLSKDAELVVAGSHDSGRSSNAQRKPSCSWSAVVAAADSPECSWVRSAKPLPSWRGCRSSWHASRTGKYIAQVG